MKLFLISSFLVAQSAFAGGGGGGCHYPDIETYSCTGTTKAGTLVEVDVAHYIDLEDPYTTYVAENGKPVSYMGQTKTTKVQSGAHSVFHLKSTQNADVDAEILILHIRKNTEASLSGHVGSSDVLGLNMQCKYSYRIQC
jgi:hypothetical protein